MGKENIDLTLNTIKMAESCTLINPHVVSGVLRGLKKLGAEYSWYRTCTDSDKGFMSLHVGMSSPTYRVAVFIRDNRSDKEIVAENYKKVTDYDKSTYMAIVNSDGSDLRLMTGGMEVSGGVLREDEDGVMWVSHKLG